MTVSEWERPIKCGVRTGSDGTAAPKTRVAVAALAAGDTDRWGHRGGSRGQRQGLHRDIAPNAHDGQLAPELGIALM